MAKPTASDSGTKSERATPVMKKDGTNTARTESMARSRGTITSRLPSSTARARGAPRPRCVWMFSIATVASSTRIPTASARPPSVMMLIVCPAPHRRTTAARSANGIVATTMSALLRSRRNRSTTSPVRTAPTSPSSRTDVRALRMYVDWSNSKRTAMSSGTRARNRGRLSFTSRTTARVEASALLVTGM
jgi:hypothetical protein